MNSILNTRLIIRTTTRILPIMMSAVLSLSIVGCGGGGGGGVSASETPAASVPTAPTTTPSTGTTCANRTLEADTKCMTINERESILYEPTGQEIDGIALFLHGSPGHASKVMNIFDAKSIADKYNLLALSPEGTTETWGWLSNNTIIEQPNMDVDYLKELILKARGEYNISSDKLFVFGYSAGGFMAYKLACDMPEQITAIVSLAGQYRGVFDACTTSTPVNIHHFHSLTDEDVPYYGRTAGNIASVKDTIAHWQNKNGCDLAVEITKDAGVTSDSEETTTEKYQSCVSSIALSKMKDVPHEADYLADKLLDIFAYLLVTE